MIEKQIKDYLAHDHGPCHAVDKKKRDTELVFMEKRKKIITATATAATITALTLVTVHNDEIMADNVVQTTEKSVSTRNDQGSSSSSSNMVSNSSETSENKSGQETVSQRQQSETSSQSSSSSAKEEQQSKTVAAATDSKAEQTVSSKQQVTEATANYTNNKNLADKNLTEKTVKVNDDYNTQADQQEQDNDQKQNEAQAKLVQAQTQAQNSAKEEIKAAVPIAQTDDPAKAYETGHVVNADLDLPTHLIQPQITNAAAPTYYDFYGYNGENDTSDKINGTLTHDQQYELADYALTLLNNWRTDNGMDQIHYNQNVEEATLELINLRNEENKDFEHITFNNQETAIFSKYDLSLVGENLGVSISQETTLLQLKVETLNAITAMIWQDKAHYNGHLLNFENAEYMGFGVQANKNMTYPYQLVFEMAELSGSKDTQTPDIQLTSESFIEGKRDAAITAFVEADEGVRIAKANILNIKNESQHASILLQSQRRNELNKINTLHETALGALYLNYQNELSTLQDLKSMHSEPTNLIQVETLRKEKQHLIRKNGSSNKMVTSRLEISGSGENSDPYSHETALVPTRKHKIQKRSNYSLPQLGAENDAPASLAGIILFSVATLFGFKTFSKKKR